MPWPLIFTQNLKKHYLYLSWEHRKATVLEFDKNGIVRNFLIKRSLGNLQPNRQFTRYGFFLDSKEWKKGRENSMRFFQKLQKAGILYYN